MYFRFFFTVVKEGVCPVVEGDSFGFCAQECSDDAHCAGSKKCCSNGCGHVCVDAEPGKFIAVQTVGCLIFDAFDNHENIRPERII